MADGMKKIENEEALADVAGGGDGWFGRDEAPDGHDIGCWSKMSWYPEADDYCPVLNGFHDYNTGRIEFAKDEMKRNCIRRYCKCGRYAIDERETDGNGIRDNY